MESEEIQLNEWRLMFAEKKNSGLKLPEFCKLKNITPARYYYYLNKINKIDNPKHINKLSNLKPIQLVNPAQKETTSIRFILPNNIQCILPRDMCAAEIKSILELVISC